MADTNTKRANGVLAPTEAFPFPTLPVSLPRLLDVTQAMIAHGTSYKLGAKAASLTMAPGNIGKIDCSGYVRYALFQASGLRLTDGSVNQHDWIKEQGFKRSTVEAGKLNDGALRIAFLTPTAGGGVGHVMLIHSARTLESHGGVGVSRRAWNPDQYSFMGKCSVYVLTPPTSEKSSGKTDGK